MPMKPPTTTAPAVIRPTATQRKYDYRWSQRARRFREQYPLCGMRPHGQRPVFSRCYDQQRVTLATMVDHVRPHRGDAGLFNDWEFNWQALCAACHQRKTNAGL